MFDPIAVEIRDNYLWVTLQDRCVIGTPLDVFNWLQNATPEQQQDFQLLPQTILWDTLDEAIDTKELLIGYKSPLKPTQISA